MLEIEAPKNNRELKREGREFARAFAHMPEILAPIAEMPAGAAVVLTIHLPPKPGRFLSRPVSFKPVHPPRSAVSRDQLCSLVRPIQPNSSYLSPQLAAYLA